MPTNPTRTAGLPIALALVSFSALTAAAALLSGCPGTLDNPEAFGLGGACPDIPPFLASKCGTAGCHVGPTPAQKLDLSSPGVAARVAGQPATLCVGNLLANPSDPMSSVLYRKLTDAPPCGGTMPIGGPPLTDAELDCIAEWIGTLEPGPPADAGADDAADAAD